MAGQENASNCWNANMMAELASARPGLCSLRYRQKDPAPPCIPTAEKADQRSTPEKTGSMKPTLWQI
jgi:hypothetical protein